MREVELLAPAGDLEKLKIAFIYGADAVYIGGEVFGMRSAAKNFSKEDMIEGVEFAHSMGKSIATRKVTGQSISSRLPISCVRSMVFPL